MMLRAELLLIALFGSLALAQLGDKLDRRAAPVVPPVIERPSFTVPDCPRLRPMAGRVDTIVIDHVLVYRCGRA